MVQVTEKKKVFSLFAHPVKDGGSEVKFSTQQRLPRKIQMSRLFFSLV